MQEPASIGAPRPNRRSIRINAFSGRRMMRVMKEMPFRLSNIHCPHPEERSGFLRKSGSRLEGRAANTALVVRPSRRSKPFVRMAGISSGLGRFFFRAPTSRNGAPNSAKKRMSPGLPQDRKVLQPGGKGCGRRARGAQGPYPRPARGATARLVSPPRRPLAKGAPTSYLGALSPRPPQPMSV